VTNPILIAVLTGAALMALAAGVLFTYFRQSHSPPVERGGPRRKAAFRTMAQWYAGRQCAMCGRDIPPLSHFAPEPGVMNPADGSVSTLAWTDIPAERVSEILETHRPVCASCHLMTWFQFEHPDLLIDRHRTQETDAPVHEVATGDSIEEA
jgi:hypothetical protein